ncbi:hypothetical protein [Stenomitos frigidus]|uniref:Uncharacterized protein n=1 Tax=Stenomitos frigidus ULC18 TaxID=2107698 RepID=A0A2T1EBS2_9CYAN|nr:hypothetical protein [Stenomitos frigidus]PSB30143.1 hypothetical protein C7B82_09305 [Stenomitos frigidus ULC18]
MTPQEVLSAAKQGNPQAIAALMNRSLNPKGIKVKTKLTGSELHVMLEAEHTPNQQALVAYVSKGIANLKIESIKNLAIYGRVEGEDFPAWSDRVGLTVPHQAVESGIETAKTEPGKAKQKTTPTVSDDPYERPVVLMPTTKKAKATAIVLGVIASVVMLVVADTIGLFRPLSPQAKPSPSAVASTPSQPETSSSSDSTNSGDLVSFKEAIAKIDPDNTIIASIDSSSIPGEAVITVQNVWHSQPYQTRLQTAQNLQRAWVRVGYPTQPDKARIKLVDLNGNHVGGSGWLAGSLVDVDK